MLNYQGIKKPAYYAFTFLNKLGETELANNDSESYACKNSKGDVQLLLWNFTNTHPGDSVNNQVYYVRDLPSKSKGKVVVSLSGIPQGNYTMELYKVGYKVNDAYATYLSMNKPAQLTKQQVEEIKKANDGSPVVKEEIQIAADGKFSKALDLRENDVYFVNLVKR